MNYQEAKAAKERIADEVGAFGDKLSCFPRNSIGLTPDSVKFSPEYKKAKADFNFAFRKYQLFNIYFLKEFAKEYRAERLAKIAVYA